MFILESLDGPHAKSILETSVGQLCRVQLERTSVREIGEMTGERNLQYVAQSSTGCLLIVRKSNTN